MTDNRKESGSPCPSCGSANTFVKRKRVLSATTVVFVIMGLSFLVVPFVIDPLPDFTPKMWNLFKIFGLFIGIWILWDQVTGLPLPILGIKLFGGQYTVNGVCSDCHHKWQEKEE